MIVWRFLLSVTALLVATIPMQAANNRFEADALAYLQGPSEVADKTRLSAARYMEQKCTPVDKDWAMSHTGLEDYAGLPVQRCFYSRSQKKTEHREAATLIAMVWMLNPDATRLAKWIGSACKKAKAPPQSDCGRKLAFFLLKQNGAQFAVAGHVIETQREAGCDDCRADALIYLPFRDGVTVKLEGDPANRRQATFAGEKEALDAAEKTFFDPVTFQKIGSIGRVANISRWGDEAGPDWLARNRAAYLKAWSSASYEYLDAAVSAALKVRIQ